MGTGLRQIFLLLIPAAVFTAVLSEPIVRLLYERGEFGPSSTDTVSLALFWFSFSLPVRGGEPPAHPHVLLAPAAVDADEARRA